MTDKRVKELLDVVGDSKIVFGLEAQGHIPTIESMLWSFSGWEQIANKIGWMPDAAHEHYRVYLRHRGVICVQYDNNLTPDDTKTFEDAGWICPKHKDDPEETWFDPENGLYMGHYLAKYAYKHFPSPKDAMFEVEKLFGVNVVGDTSQDGCPIHSFRWFDPNLKVEDEIQMAMGWECAVIMYGAEKTPRETAIKLKELKEKHGK